MADDVQNGQDERFRICVCIDGSDESFRSLRYAAKLGGGVDADISLLYVRPQQQGMGSGGLQVQVARENMAAWGLESPGIGYLKKGRDLLLEIGSMAEDWKPEVTHKTVAGDPIGDHRIVYTGEGGKQIILELKSANDIVGGILDQCQVGQYDIMILGASDRWRDENKRSFWDPAVAEKVAAHAPCSVLISRDLEVGHGHLICVDGSDRSLQVALKDAYLASRCGCAISLISVASTPDKEAEARQAVETARHELEALHIDVTETLVRIGDPCNEIIEAGPDYSLIVVGDSSSGTLKRMFKGSIPYTVLQKAYNSVLLVR